MQGECKHSEHQKAGLLHVPTLTCVPSVKLILELPETKTATRAIRQRPRISGMQNLILCLVEFRIFGVAITEIIS